MNQEKEKNNEEEQEIQEGSRTGTLIETRGDDEGGKNRGIEDDEEESEK